MATQQPNGSQTTQSAHHPADPVPVPVTCAPLPSCSRASLDNMLTVNLHQARRRFSLSATPTSALPSNKPNMQPTTTSSSSSETSPAGASTAPSPTPLFPFRWNLFTLFQSSQSQGQGQAQAQNRATASNNTPSPPPRPRSQLSFTSAAAASAADADADSEPPSPPPPLPQPDPQLKHSRGGGKGDASAASSATSTGTTASTGSVLSTTSSSTSTSTPRRRRHRQKHAPTRRQPRLSAPSSCLPPGMVGAIHQCVPARHANDDWRRIYSTMHDGASLKTLYQRCRRAGAAAGVVLLIRDARGAVFGCYVSEPWHMAAHYYGNGETFVFSVVDGQPQVFAWSRANSLFQLASGASLALGGGPAGGFALFVDAMLERGASRRCSTFNSPCLASAEQFDIVVLEAYALVAPHRM